MKNNFAYDLSILIKKYSKETEENNTVENCLWVNHILRTQLEFERKLKENIPIPYKYKTFKELQSESK